MTPDLSPATLAKARAKLSTLREPEASDEVIIALIDELERVREALKGLVDRLDEIHADPVYKSVWTVNQIHAGPYTGPTYVEALARARAALASVTAPEKSG